jgi:hypothetical protein
MSRHNQFKTPAPGNAAAPPGPDAPHWIPTDYRWDRFPEEIRQAVQRVLNPAYRRFVLEAPGELERSMGLTLVHLMWLELCGQVQLAVAAADSHSIEAICQDPDRLIDRHLHLVATKCQTAELLVKLRVMTEMLNPPAPQLPPPAATVPESDGNDLPSPGTDRRLVGRGAGGEGSESHVTTAAGGEHQELPSPGTDRRLVGRGAGGEGSPSSAATEAARDRNELPSPSGRGAGGEGSASHVTTAAGGEHQKLPSPGTDRRLVGRGAVGEGSPSHVAPPPDPADSDAPTAFLNYLLARSAAPSEIEAAQGRSSSLTMEKSKTASQLKAPRDPNNGNIQNC